MKICIIGDVHFSQYSSILRQRGKQYSARLENLIKSLNWAEETAKKLSDRVIYLGDFFDRPDLNSEEITALNEVKWNELSHYFLVGNHESDVASLTYNSTKTLSQHTNFKIIDSVISEIWDNKQLLFLPYSLEENRPSLAKLLNNSDKKNVIVFSHNDIKGIQYGGFLSKEGYSLDDIKATCGMFINGHIHNGSFLDDEHTIINLGNITGQNFSEDAFTYNHHIAILDTETMKISFYVNPYAFNFYKLVIEKENDLYYINKLFTKDITHVNMVLSIKCEEKLVDKVKDLLSKHTDINTNIWDYRIIIFKADSSNLTNNTMTLQSVDHLQQFNNFVLNSIGNNAIVEEELLKICGASK